MIRKTQRYLKIDTLSQTLLFSLEEGPQYVYYGKKIRTDADYAFFLPERDYFGSAMPLRPFSAFGDTDFREPSLLVEAENGVFAARFSFVRAELCQKPDLGVLPSSYGEGESVCLLYEEDYLKLRLSLFYTAFADSDVIAVSAKLENIGETPIHIKKFSSLQLDVWGNDYTFVTFDGSWGSERQKHETPVLDGLRVNDAKTGSSSPFHNPFVMAKGKGGVYAFNLVYSGNHKESAESDAFGRTRFLVGLNDFMFDWLLLPGAAFVTPEAVMARGNTETDVSLSMHAFIHRHLAGGEWGDKDRPVLVNNWEGTGFSFTAEKIKGIIDRAAEAGAELFVLDDGWFGHRDNDASSLGDWFDYTQKTGGIASLADYAQRKGLSFGIWVEPEMISEDSELYRAHPEYAMKPPDRRPVRMRNQLMLDMAREDVQNFVIEAVSSVILSCNAAYVKWDYNRQMTDCYSPGVRGGEYYHRYLLGLYRVLREIKARFPAVLFESCASGGGRFDLGMLYFMPQTWTSDDTDARERLLIQSGTSYGYPQSAFGSHVSSSPNQQTGNRTPLETRFNMAVCGALGYEMDLTQCSQAEMDTIRRQIAFYKAHRRTFQYGALYRLGDAFQDNVTGFFFVSPDREEGIAVVAVREKRVGVKNLRFSLRGLDETAVYAVQTREQENYDRVLRYTAGGDALMGGSLVLEDIFADKQLYENSNPLYTRMYIFRKTQEGGEEK